MSLCFLPFVSVRSITRHMSVVHKEEKFGVGSFIQAEVWIFGGGSAGCFGEVAVHSSVFVRRTRASGVRRLPVPGL